MKLTTYNEKRAYSFKMDSIRMGDLKEKHEIIDMMR